MGLKMGSTPTRTIGETREKEKERNNWLNHFRSPDDGFYQIGCTSIWPLVWSSNSIPASRIWLLMYYIHPLRIAPTPQLCKEHAWSIQCTSEAQLQSRTNTIERQGSEASLPGDGHQNYSLTSRDDRKVGAAIKRDAVTFTTKIKSKHQTDH